jgi:hypothetical protein
MVIFLTIRPFESILGISFNIVTLLNHNEITCINGLETLLGFPILDKMEVTKFGRVIQLRMCEASRIIQAVLYGVKKRGCKCTLYYTI